MYVSCIITFIYVYIYIHQLDSYFGRLTHFLPTPPQQGSCVSRVCQPITPNQCAATSSTQYVLCLFECCFFLIPINAGNKSETLGKIQLCMCEFVVQVNMICKYTLRQAVKRIDKTNSKTYTVVCFTIMFISATNVYFYFLNHYILLRYYCIVFIMIITTIMITNLILWCFFALLLSLKGAFHCLLYQKIPPNP